MAHPQSDGSEKNGGEVVSREFVEAGCDAAGVFEFVEETLDEVALAVDVEIDDAADPHVALRGDVGVGAAGLDQLDDRACEEATVGDHVARQAQAVGERWECRLVGRLTGREQKPDRQAAGVNDRMNFGAQSATRTTDGVIRAPFLPPAACWWARTIEVSIR